jgi:hypothetical protein
VPFSDPRVKQVKMSECKQKGFTSCEEEEATRKAPKKHKEMTTAEIAFFFLPAFLFVFSFGVFGLY